jgi:glucose-6-phosphate 1-dehydrogenase
MEKTCSPLTIVVFGASGDLTWRKLIPALYNNYKKGRLSNCAQIVGFARRPYNDITFREHLGEGVAQFCMDTFELPVWEEFSNLLHYFQGNLGVEEDFVRLSAYLSGLENGSADRLYYLATAPEFYAPVITDLGTAGMNEQPDGHWRRIIIEKPFGTDLSTARGLNEVVHQVFSEEQVYRIDHYLGKETAQNILFFRFANTIFEPVWNRNYVKNIQITVSETVDIGHRAGYYDTAGVVRDIFQNHLLQLLALVAMEPPSSFNADAVRNEKAKLFESIRPIKLENTVRAQYEGYAGTEGVAVGSQTPTYAALKLLIDNWRWQGVPFYLRSGKAMNRKSSEIIIEFRKPPHLMFHLPPESTFSPNVLSLCIQPDEGIHLRFQAKVPDSDQEMRPVDMDFHYPSSFKGGLPDAYERLLLDALGGDASLFTRSDGIEASWRLVDPVIRGWEEKNIPILSLYARGTPGPREADELLERDGHFWREGCTAVEGMADAAD